MSSSAASPSNALPKRKASNATGKPSTDRHRKVDGRDRRVSLSDMCAQRLSELNKKLNHRTTGETVEWLLFQVKPKVDAILGTNPPIVSSPSPSLPTIFKHNLSMPPSNDVPLSTSPIASIFQSNVPLAPFGGIAFPTLPSIFTRETLSSSDAMPSQLKNNLVFQNNASLAPSGGMAFPYPAPTIFIGETSSSVDVKPFQSSENDFESLANGIATTLFS